MPLWGFARGGLWKTKPPGYVKVPWAQGICCHARAIGYLIAGAVAGVAFIAAWPVPCGVMSYDPGVILLASLFPNGTSPGTFAGSFMHFKLKMQVTSVIILPIRGRVSILVSVSRY